MNNTRALKGSGPHTRRKGPAQFGLLPDKVRRNSKKRFTQKSRSKSRSKSISPEGFQCPICLSGFDLNTENDDDIPVRILLAENEKTGQTQGNHTYHKSCILEWCRGSSRVDTQCNNPMTREPFNPKTDLVRCFKNRDGKKGITGPDGRIHRIKHVRKLVPAPGMPNKLQEAAVSGTEVPVSRIRVILESMGLLTPAADRTSRAGQGDLPFDKYVSRDNEDTTDIEIPIDEWMQHTGLTVDQTRAIEENTSAYEGPYAINFVMYNDYDGRETPVINISDNRSDWREDWAQLQ